MSQDKQRPFNTKILRETVISHVEGDDFCTIDSSERKWINDINRKKERFPELVDIRHVNPDGSLYARVPYAWFRSPSPKRKVAPMSKERRDAAAIRFAKARELKNLQ